MYHMNDPYSTMHDKQFVTRLRKLTNHCEYGDTNEEHIRDQVIAHSVTPNSYKKNNSH